MTPQRFVSHRKHDDKWIVKLAGAQRAAAATEKKVDAVDIARDIARRNKEELVIKDMKGRIQQKDSYGHDPRNIPG